jgi:hypothetical protein
VQHSILFCEHQDQGTSILIWLMLILFIIYGSVVSSTAARQNLQELTEEGKFRHPAWPVGAHASRMVQVETPDGTSAMNCDSANRPVFQCIDEQQR